MAVELTGPQLRQPVLDGGTNGVASATLGKPRSTRKRKGQLSWDEILDFRNDPTVRLARLVLIGPALIAGWSVDAEKDTDPVLKDFVEKQVVPLHDYIMRQGLLGMSDWGWCAFEKVFGVAKDMNGATRIIVSKLKHLLHDITDILVDKENGAFAGLLNGPRNSGQRDIVEIEDCLLLYQNVEGTNWYGESDLITLEPTMRRYNRTIDASDRYDAKVAGAHWIIYYPVGMTNYNGSLTDNFQIAQNLMNSLESSGSIVVPSQIQAHINNLNSIAPEHQSWRIELLSADSATNTAILDKMKYYDTLKVRGYGIPERSILEGRYGTKAEADEHGDVATVNINIRRNDITREVNWHLVNQLLRINWGEESQNKVWLVPNPINDEILRRNSKLFEKIVADPTFGAEEIARTNTDYIRSQLRIPTLSPEEAAQREAMATRMDRLIQPVLIPPNPQNPQNPVPLLPSNG